MLRSWFLLFLMGSAAGFAQSDTLIIENGVMVKKYLLSQIDSITFYVPVVGVEESETAGSPVDFAVSQNYPNPFNPSTQMKCTIPQAGKVAVKIFDINGALIRELFTGEKDKGNIFFSGTVKTQPVHQLPAGHIFLLCSSTASN